MDKKALENYECDGQTDIFDFIEPVGGFKCKTCVYYQDLRPYRKKGDPEKMSCILEHNPLHKSFKPVIECERYKPDSRHFKCCETCEYGNCFCEANCWLVDKENKETPNRHHREGFPDYGKDYHDLHEWDICDAYKMNLRYKGQELL